ncbi:major facilitator superfamily domain-containing protein [Aspergillus californicus]
MAAIPSGVHRWRILLTSSLVLFLLDFGFYLTIPAQTSIFEGIICAQYHAEGNCKATPVQSELAFINGWKDTFDALPGILLSIPYGVLADRIGRKPCLLLCLIGLLLGEFWTRIVCFWPQTLSLRLVWLSGAFRVLGGGDMVTSSLVCVIVADSFANEDQATALFQLTSVILVAEMLAIPLGGALMEWSSPWVAFTLGLGIFALGIPLAAFLIPETLPVPFENSEEEEREGPEDGDKRSLKTSLSLFISSTRFITQQNILLALLLFLVSSLGRQSTSLMLQYSSTRYNWAFSRASLFLSVRGFVTLSAFLLVMPALSRLITKKTTLSALHKDQRLSQLSGILLSIGLAMIALAAIPAWYITGLVISALGAGFFVFARSLVTQLVTPAQRSTLYAAIAVMQSVGSLVAGPLLASLFRAGLTMGRDKMGLPFLVAGALVFVGVGAVSVIRVKDAPVVCPGDGEDGDYGERQALLGSA